MGYLSMVLESLGGSNSDHDEREQESPQPPTPAPGYSPLRQRRQRTLGVEGHTGRLCGATVRVKAEERAEGPGEEMPAWVVAEAGPLEDLDGYPRRGGAGMSWKEHRSKEEARAPRHGEGT